MNGAEVAIEDFCETGSGGTPDRNNKKYFGGSIPWVKSGELNEDVILDTEEKITQAALLETSAKLIPSGSILLAMYGATVGRMAFLGVDAATNQAVCNIRPDPKRADARYVFHGLQSKMNHFVSRAAGGAQPNISQGIVRETKLFLPSLEEQQRIAATLDKADALRRKRKRTLELLDSLSQAVFTQMFGDLEVNSFGWTIMPFDAVVSIDAPLVDPKLEKYSRLLHYGPDRIEKDTGRLLPAQSAREDNLVSNKFLCDNRHILYSKIRPYLNKVALSETECLCSADVYPVSVRSTIADRMYVWFLLRSNAFLRYSEACSSRANIPKINREQFLAYQAPIPPLALQEQFALRVGLVEKSFRRMVGSKSAGELLFSSLQQRAFAGELP